MEDKLSFLFPDDIFKYEIMSYFQPIRKKYPYMKELKKELHVINMTHYSSDPRIKEYILNMSMSVFELGNDDVLFFQKPF